MSIRLVHFFSSLEIYGKFAENLPLKRDVNCHLRSVHTKNDNYEDKAKDIVPKIIHNIKE